MAKFRTKTGTRFKAGVKTAIIGILFVLLASYVNADCGCIGVNTNTAYKCGDYVNESCVLNCNLTCTGNGLIVNADNIVLDGNGYTLTGPEVDYSGNEYTVGIVTNNKENITIKNFEIRNFSNGIIPVPLHPLGSSMKNYTITNNKIHHISSCGISLRGALYSKIINNTCYSIKLDGIDALVANNSVIENNTCYNNRGGIGFYGSTTQNNTIKNNNLYNNKWGIIFGWAGPNHNKILNNKIYNNTLFGIYLYYGSSFNEIYNNTIKSNKNGIFLTKCHPLKSKCYPNNVTNNTIAYNKILQNSEYGIFINSSTNNTIISNKICENIISDVAVFNGIINATGNSGDNNSCTSGINYKDISASGNNSCAKICKKKDNSTCSSNSECLSNKCVNHVCKTPTKNITVGLVIKFPDNKTIKKCVKVNEYANGKEILDASGIKYNGTLSSSWGLFLKCINNTCSPPNWSWYWSFYMHKINETNWHHMPVTTGPGGTNNDFCWNRNYNSNKGSYCARDGDVILLNATIGRSVLSSEGKICKKDNSTCSSNSECLSNKCVNHVCKTPTKNITVGLIIKFPDNKTIKKCVKVNEYANGKEILDASGIKYNGSLSSSWGLFLKCINNTCSPPNWSWYWSFYMHKINETNWHHMPVTTGPGGTNNDFCWNRNYNSNKGSYCARDGDVILLNATIGRSVKSYSWCTEGDFDNNNLTNIFDVVTALEYLSGKNYSEECIRKENIDLFEVFKVIEKIVLS